METSSAIILYDGLCGFCNDTVAWILKNDRRKRIFFAALQSEKGRSLLRTHGIDENVDSIVFIYHGKAYLKSSAVLKIGSLLGFPHVMMGIGWIVPKFIRDFFYDAFAKRRYKWFGKATHCTMPSPEDSVRFLK